MFTAGEEKGKLGKEKKDEETKGTKALQAKGAAAPGLWKNSQLLQSAVGFCFHGGELSHPLFIQSWLALTQPAPYLSTHPAKASVTAMKPCCTRPN